MAVTTEEKLIELEQLFPDYDKESLLDVLVSCRGSLREVVLLIDGDLSRIEKSEPESKRLKTKTKPQQTLFSCIPSKVMTPVKIPTSQNGKPIMLHSKVDIESTLPYCTYHTNVFPEELADALLKMTFKDKEAAPNEFYLFGNKCVSNHKTRIYSSQSNRSSLHYNGQKVKNVGDYNDELVMAQLIVEDVVNESLKKREVLRYQIKPGDWKVQTVLCNIYERDSNLDWHSDRLTNIGPHAIIASVSLGFAREFRVRKTYPSNSQIYAITPRHNSLLIMHAGFQEEYKHCVPPLPKKRAIPADEMHPISETIRVNLTYRSYIMGTSVNCEKCGYPMELRRTFREARNRGKYIWQCAKSYTTENGHKSGKECKGIRFAKLDEDPPVTKDEKLCCRWLADDDLEAKQAQIK